MKRDWLLALIAILLCSHLHGQDSVWIRTKIDENLVVTLPKRNRQSDTAFSEKDQTYRYRIFKAETQVAVLVVTVTPNGTGIDVDDEESLRAVLDSFERGTCKSLSEKQLICRSKDSLLDGLPCKKIEAFVTGFKDPIFHNYCLLVNDKLYMFTITPLLFTPSRIQLSEESTRFLNGIRFTKTVREKQFLTKAESNGYKFGYYLVPFLLFVGFIAFVVIRIVKS
jgi:hypothetical protein